MPPHRHRKFVRSVEPPGQLRLQPRDEELFRDLASYRFMDTEQILALYPRGARNTRRRLATLFHLGFLDRPVQQKAFAKQGMSLIYGLGPQGKGFFVDDEWEPKERKPREVTFPYLQHAMMISRFHSSFILALRRKKPEERMKLWMQGTELKRALKRENRELDLVPDAFFEVEGPKGILSFFLEADQGTMTRDRFLAKMKTYWQWYRSEFVKPTLGMERFRVLTIAPTYERKENLRRITKKADYRQEGSNMFQFLSEEVYSTKRPDSILGPIWMSPKDDIKRAIVGD